MYCICICIGSGTAPHRTAPHMKLKFFENLIEEVADEVTKQFVMEEKQDPRPIQGYYE